MGEGPQQDNPGGPVTLGALFVGFLTISMLGFGGPIVWARRILVERYRWLDDREFAEIVGLCQFLPGPNMVCVTVCVGLKFRGWAGALTAVAGFILIPWTLGFALGMFYLQYTDIAAVQGILRGIAAVAAGLIIATGLRLLRPYRARPAALLFAASISLVAHIALLSAISFGGVPGVLPDLREFVVDRHGWLSNQDFANYFAIVQALPGPNMIMMMSFIGWKVGGLPTAIASAVVTFAPPCAFAAVVFRWWDRFRDMPWHGAARRGLAPVTIGLVIAGGAVMAWAGDVGWPGVAVTATATAAMLASRINPLWLLGGGAILGGCGWL